MIPPRAQFKLQGVDVQQEHVEVRRDDSLLRGGDYFFFHAAQHVHLGMRPGFQLHPPVRYVSGLHGGA